MPVTDPETRTERALVALLKQARGERLTKRDDADAKWYRLETANEILDRIPKKKYVELSGRAAKTLHDQARKYDIPLDQPVINLFEVVRRFHDILAKHGRSFESDEDSDELKKQKLEGEIDVLKKRAKILDNEINQQKSKYIPREEMRKGLDWLVSKFHSLGERFGRIGGAEHGPDLQRSLNEFFDEVQKEIESGSLSTGNE